MNSKNLLLGVFVVLTVAFASLALNEYNQVGILSAQLQSRTRTTQTITYYYSPSVTIPVVCCPGLPTSFVVGSLNGNIYDLYGFNVTSDGGPKIIGSGPTRTLIHTGPMVAFKVYQPIPVVYQPNPSPLRIQWANFTWGGTFSETVPGPSNATLFDGAVKMSWFVNSSLLYLHITTK